MTLTKNWCLFVPHAHCSADVKMEGNDIPRFVGTVEEQRRRSLAGLITMARDTGEYEHPLDVLEQTLGDGFAVRQVRRTDHEIRIDSEHRRSHWRGGVVLVWKNQVFSSN